jgi:AcrR family transcriptional regulator
MPKIVDHREARDTLLRAAGTVLRREGIVGLTFDAIAAEAGVSKGGVLHYFNTKQHLLAALVRASMEAFEIAVDARATRDPEPKGAWTRAYLFVSAMPGDEGQHTGYAIAWANDPSLLKLVQERYSAWRVRLEHDGLDPIVASLVRIAADGLWQADGLGLSPPRGRSRRALLQKIDALTRG